MFVFTTCSSCTVNVHAQAASPKVSLPTIFALLMLENSLLNENVTCCPHPVCGCIKLLSKETYGLHTTDMI